MSRWLDRPGYVAILAFVGGAAAAVIVVLIVLLTRGGGEDSEQQTLATTTAGTTPVVTGTPPTPGPPATAAPGFDDPDEALDAFVRDELSAEHIGECPLELPEGDLPAGVCSQELYRTEELVTFMLGVPFSEGIGEAVLTLNEDGFWSVNFVQAPPLGEFAVSVGSEAVVFGAGSCLNFREEPSLSAIAAACQIDGTRGQVWEGPVQADEITWWRLEGLGWASGEFLVPVTE